VLTFAGFAVIVGAAVAWTAVTAIRRGLPTIGDASAELTRARLVRMIVVIGWAWIGWHLFVRTSVFD
jgi:hypothetical protein